MDKVVLDTKDRKLLLELQRDSRQPLSELAHSIGASKEVTHYRLNRLMQNGIILRLYTEWQPQSIGLDNYAVYFKIEGMTPDTELNIYSFAENHAQVAWIATLSGRFDLVIRLYAQNASELEEFLSAFLNQFGESVSEKQVTVRTEQKYFYSPRRLFKGMKLEETVKTKPVQTDIVLKKEDQQILLELFKNSRMSISELASKTDMAPETIKNHIKDLTQKKVITGFGCYTNRSKLGFDQYKTFIRLKYPIEKTNELAKWCESHIATNFMSRCIGPWELEVAFDTEDNEEFQTILKEMRGKFKESIADISWALVTKEKLLYWP